MGGFFTNEMEDICSSFWSSDPRWPRRCGVWGVINLLEGYGRTTPVPMLMYGKEASNRKQEIDRQHYTIPNQRPKDKHCGKI